MSDNVHVEDWKLKAWVKVTLYREREDTDMFVSLLVLISDGQHSMLWCCSEIAVLGLTCQLVGFQTFRTPAFSYPSFSYPRHLILTLTLTLTSNPDTNTWF